VAELNADDGQWLKEYRRFLHTQLDRVQASAQVWLGILTTVVGLAGSVVLIKGSTLLTGLTSSRAFLWVSIGLIALGFVFALMAMIAGAAATWGGLSALDTTEPSVREAAVFRPILFFAFDREPLPEFPHPSNDGARWEIRYRRTAVSRRNLLHASRTLGVITAAIVGALAVVLLLASVVAPAPTDVIVVHDGHLTCGPISNAQEYANVTRVIPVSQC
jgi:hypothetical protein